MLDFSQMITRLLLALALGALIGLERELVGKEAGVRTAMMVAGGAAIFTLIGLSLPYIIAQNSADIPAIIERSGFTAIIANIVIGTGFLGAGIIIKTQSHVYGLTSAAVIWTVAAIGVLAGLGMVAIAVASAAIVALLLFALRHFGISELREGKEKGG